MTLYASLAKIMGEVGTVEKKGKITSRGDGPTYKFARDIDVLEAVIPKMSEAGIVMVPAEVELLSIEPTPSGKQLLANIRTKWHVTDGKESLFLQTLGQGADSGDKALPKAQSNARKYALFMLYHIVTGDDPDHWASTEQPEQGERGRMHGKRPPATTPAPVSPSRTPEENAVLDEILALPGMTHEKMRNWADVVGVPKGERANLAQLLAILDFATADKEPTLEDVLAVTGGEEVK